MKSLQFFILILLVSVNGFSQTAVNVKYCETISMEQFRGREDFNDIIDKLNTQNRLSTSNASAIKLVSSNSFVAFEQTPDSIVNQHGKIDEDDINLVFQVTTVSNEYLFLITSHQGFGHAFKYDVAKSSLERYRNRGHVNLHFDPVPEVEACCDSEITIILKNSPKETNKWIKYFSLDLNNNIFTNTKNCRIIDDKEECKEIEPFNFKD